MYKEIEYCPHCGSKNVIYKHVLSTMLVNILIKFYKKTLELKGKNTQTVIRISKDIGLTHTEINNFQKLKYFGFVLNVNNGWILLKKGEDFLKGNIKSQNFVLTKNGNVIEYNENTKELYNKFGNLKEVTIYDFNKCYIKFQDRDDFENMASLQIKIPF